MLLMAFKQDSKADASGMMLDQQPQEFTEVEAFDEDRHKCVLTLKDLLLCTLSLCADIKNQKRSHKPLEN